MGAALRLCRPLRVRCLASVLGAALIAVAALNTTAAAADLSSPQIIAALNRQREANGIPPVRNDKSMAAGCADYNRYVVRNGLSVSDTHYEDPHLPGYTAAGDRAARTSVLAATAGVVVLFGPPLFPFGWSQGDPWNNAAFHLFQMMNPALAVSGADELTARLRDGRWVRLECLNTVAGRYRAAPAKLHTYFYPRSGTKAPLFEQNQEGESALGVGPGAYGPPLLFAYFFGRGVTRLPVLVHATVDGKSVGFRTAAAGGAAVAASASAAALESPFASGPNFSAPRGPGFFSPIPAIVGMPEAARYRDIIEHDPRYQKWKHDQELRKAWEKMEEQHREERRPFFEKKTVPYAEKLTMAWLMGLASSPGPTGR